MRLPNLGTLADEGLIVAPDGRYLATSTGRVVAVSNNLLVDSGVRARFPGQAASWSVMGFADGDRALVAQTNVPGRPLAVDVATLGDGQVTSLGDAHSAAGDPQALGAFVTVASPRLLPATGTVPGWARTVVDADVERRDAGQATEVLATAGELATDVGEPSQTPVELTVLPDRAGDRVAVMINPPLAGSSGPRWAGIVVLDRRGRILGTDRTNRAIGGTPAWSPDGASLVYKATGGGRVEITLWTIGHRPDVRDGPAVDQTPDEQFNDYCMWATDGRAFLCRIVTNLDSSTLPWVIGDLRGRVRTVSGPILPLAWFSGAAKTT